MGRIAELRAELRSFAKDLTLPEDTTEWDWEKIVYDLEYANQWYEKQRELFHKRVTGETEVHIDEMVEEYSWAYKFIQITGVGAFHPPVKLLRGKSPVKRVLRFFGLNRSRKKEA